MEDTASRGTPSASSETECRAEDQIGTPPATSDGVERAFQLGSRQSSKFAQLDAPPLGRSAGGSVSVSADDTNGPVGNPQDLNNQLPGRDTLVEQDARMSTMLDRIESHFAAQADWQDQFKDSWKDLRAELAGLNLSLERLTDGSSAIHETISSQTGILAEVRDGLTKAASARKRFDEELVQLPKMADAQRETMVSMSRQLELIRETMGNIGESLENLHSTTSTLAAATSASSKGIDQLSAAIRTRDEKLLALLAEQVDRFSKMGWIALSLVALVALTGFIALFR